MSDINVIYTGAMADAKIELKKISEQKINELRQQLVNKFNQ